MSLSPIGITMGCPAGIGPEIIIKAFYETPSVLAFKDLVVLGDMNILERAKKVLSYEIPLLSWKPGQSPSSEGINVLCLTQLDPSEIPFGKPSEKTGAASFKYIEKGIELCQDETLSAVVTAPISKLGLKLAGIPFPGHTEILARKTGTKKYAMMLSGKTLRVVLVTIHCPLREVPYRISPDNIYQTIKITHNSLRLDFGLTSPRIAVCSLNPHGGEGGMFGGEEETVIVPAIKKASSHGIDATGPYPPDTVFYHASKGNFDAVVCQYHDQGLIPFKLLHFKDGVNITLGLPIVRTSVDHGTAYDLVGKGIADSSSLVEAIKTALFIAKNRRK